MAVLNSRCPAPGCSAFHAATSIGVPNAVSGTVFDGFRTENHFYGGYGIVGAQIGLAAGMAFASKYRNEDRVTVCYFGDAAASRDVLSADGWLANVLGANAWIVEPRRDRMRVLDLAVVVHQEVGAVAVQHAGPAAGD